MRYRSEQVIARLRAHKLVPAGVPVRLVHLSGPSRHHDGIRLLWQAADARSGDPLGVGSAHTLMQVARCPDWRIAEQDGIKVISLATAEVTP